MADNAPGSAGADSLKEPLRRLDAVLSFARKLQIESGEVPAGVFDDFNEARKAAEKAFAFHFQGVSDEVQRQFRTLIKGTRGMTLAQFADHLEKVARMARQLANAVVVQGEPTLQLEPTSEHGAVAFDDDAVTQRQVQARPVAPTEQPAPAAGPRRGMAPVLLAAAAVLVLGGLGVGLWLAGVFQPPAARNAIAGGQNAANTPQPGNNRPPGNTPTDESFDPAASGYPERLIASAMDRSQDPLTSDPDRQLPVFLAELLLGLEEDIELLEPGRLKQTTAQTRTMLAEFGRGMVEAEGGWRQARKPFLDALVQHTQEKLRLALYRDAQGTVLLSDVLYTAGGDQVALPVAYAALARSGNAPVELLAPNGAGRPVIGVALTDGVHTFNGESFALREGSVPALAMHELLVETAVRLRPTMTTPAGRTLCSALVLHQGRMITQEQARQALTDLDPAWLAPAGGDAVAAMLNRLAGQLQIAVCRQLLAPEAGGNAAEALALYRLAAAAQDDDSARQAVLLLGQRAEKGALLDGEPLVWRVAELLRQQRKFGEAERWYERALQEHPEDPRPALRLAERRTGAERLACLQAAYARGWHEAAFLRDLLREQSLGGDNLAALAIADELLATEKAEAADLETAVLLCVALERPDWALARLSAAPVLARQPRLQRLDLICELQQNGLSPRAVALAQEWRAAGTKDPYLESLLQRHGG
ncbi:MAG: hypothetical protein IT463_13185 [Planctomycetes bacterium]|nr:hypothetical protein [Planctomycetota bacterium]